MSSTASTTASPISLHSRQVPSSSARRCVRIGVPSFYELINRETKYEISAHKHFFGYTWSMASFPPLLRRGASTSS